MLAPFGFTEAFSVAPVWLIPLAALVVTLGAGQALVVKVRSAPFLVPRLFVALARKWWSVPHASPEMVRGTATALVPAPIAVAVVVFV